ncbi:MAG: hypothetical protein PF638_00970 [Candidatus Delongbacteria bacterium]|jgi:hypothetical protein|nr:hypothetical protein [Candidatus Delongbacteria bacterium]
MLKKLILIMLMFITVSNVISAEKYAVIITGDDVLPKADDNDKTYFAWCMIQY